MFEMWLLDKCRSVIAYLSQAQKNRLGPYRSHVITLEQDFQRDRAAVVFPLGFSGFYLKEIRILNAEVLCKADGEEPVWYPMPPA